MSADNFATISKSTFEIREKCASCPESNGFLIGKGKDLDDAIRIYDEWLKKENEESPFGYYEVEYGLHFID